MLPTFTQASIDPRPFQFTVPSGFCVITTAYNAHIEEHPFLKKLIAKLHCYGS